MNTPNTGSRSTQTTAGTGQSRTGVRDESYDLISTLANKLEELWRIDEFINDASDQRDKKIWQQIRDHDRADVDALKQELAKHLSNASRGKGSTASQ